MEVKGLMTKPDNPAAFPQFEYNPNRQEMISVNGMLLRDYFAGQALVGRIQAHHPNENPSKLAEWAYQDADAMLLERTKNNE